MKKEKPIEIDGENKEIFVKKFGDIEVYDKRGLKVLKIDGQTIEKERRHNLYEKLNPKGNVLMLGLGLGLFKKAHSNRIKKLVSVEKNKDVIDIYKEYNTIDDKHTIIHGDGLTYLDGSKEEFDYIFMDFLMNRPGYIPDKLESFINDAARCLKKKGNFVMLKNNNWKKIVENWKKDFKVVWEDEDYLIMERR